MHNNTPYGHTSQGLVFDCNQGVEWKPSQLPSTNRFIYVKQRVQDSTQTENGTQRVLVNPHFKAKSKVYVNPNFSRSTISSGPAIHINPRLTSRVIHQLDDEPNMSYFSEIESTTRLTTLQRTKIHINPNVKSVQIPINSQTVHINPKFTNKTPNNIVSNVKTIDRINQIYETKENVPAEKLNKIIVLTKTKLVRTPQVSSNHIKLKRRNSVKSKYKIVKTDTLKKNTTLGNNRRTDSNTIKNKFKVDNRRRKSLSIIHKHKKYVYVNKLVSSSDLVKTRIIKGNLSSRKIRNPNVVTINGIVYKNSRNSLRKAFVPVSKEIINNQPILETQYRLTTKSKLKNATRKVDFETRGKVVKKFKIIRKQNPKKNKPVKISPKKLRKCNIPCPTYKKYGICKGMDNGKCSWKHDPDQIALCTRFLQGACIKKKCLLSHNVSPEKMPTCKYYLEGSCSRDCCPYLHVKISPKAEVCKDFLEGFCKKATECDKRHQYLCPDYEKYGKCVKQRCSYPHGKMVRNYMINKNKFAKKCSDPKIENKKNAITFPTTSDELDLKKCIQINDKRRYYAEKQSKPEESTSESANLNIRQSEIVDEVSLKNFIGLQSRPKLGSLPSYIPFGDS